MQKCDGCGVPDERVQALDLQCGWQFVERLWQWLSLVRTAMQFVAQRLAATGELLVHVQHDQVDRDIVLTACACSQHHA